MSPVICMRTHTCGDLRKDSVGDTVTLCGWVHSNRDHGGLIFIDLRDRYGMTQIVFNPEVDQSNHETADRLRREDVIQVTGQVEMRKEGMHNPNLSTGDIEVNITELTVLNKSDTPPIEVDDRIVANDEMRLAYRYLDLRRPIMQKNLRLRYEAAMAAREFLDSQNFLEVETPMLIRSTPEGARDYVVPSRVNPGRFYALPQSPQLYKQILMISGVDRYFQFARCLRDEDLRADRQPEHTQIDLEMSFVKARDVMDLVEGTFRHMVSKVFGKEVKEFPVFTYDEAMARFGCDKPDIRFGLELTDVTHIVKDCDFSVFRDAVKKGGIVKCINPQYEFPRKEIDGLIDHCIGKGAKGMAWMRVTENGLESNIAKYFSEEKQKCIIDAMGAKPGSTLMFIADKPATANDVISDLRLEVGRRLDLIDEDKLAFCWVVDYPLFEWNEDEQKWDPMHNIFSMPKEECLEYLEKDPSKVYADLFDLVLNGVELGSGAIRINRPDIQRRALDVIGFDEEKAKEAFGFLMDAYRYGGPPHGGMGLGFDRFIAIMTGTHDIREVIAFPKNKAAQNPMDTSPAHITDEQLKELHIRLQVAKQDSASKPADGKGNQ